MKTSPKNSTNLIIIVFLLLSFFIAQVAMAGNTIAPAKKIEQLFSKIEQEVNTLKHKQVFNKQELKQLLNQHLMPEVNNRYFALKVLGKHVKTMDDNLKRGYVNELENQLMLSYANLLSKYNNEKVLVTSEKISSNNKHAQVAINVINQQKTVSAVIKLNKNSENQWLIFDIVIEGISLLQSKQSEVQSSISKIGIEKTLEKLKELNLKKTNS